MSRMTLRLIAGILTFAVGVTAVAGWYLWRHPHVQVPTTTVDVPVGWQKVDINGLYLLIPAGMKQHEVHGIDTYDFKYGDESTTLNIEYGINQGDFSDLTRHPNYREESVMIDGRAAKLRFCHNDSSAMDYGDAEHTYIAAIYFQMPWDNSFSLNLWAKSKDATGQELAKQSFLTLKFKQFKN